MFKIILFGFINYIVRFAVGGFLFMGIKMNPIGFWYGSLLTLTALISTLIFLKFIIKPKTSKSAAKTIIIWILIALALDIVTAEPIVHVNISYLLSEIQTWTRLLIMFLAIPFAKNTTKQTF